MEHVTEQGGGAAISGRAPEQSPGVLAVEPDCPKCTGPRVTCDVGHVGIYGWWLERTVRAAGALGPVRTVTAEVRALACIRCGYTEFYATRPQFLVPEDDKH